MLNLTYWLLAIVLFGMVILLHELGHFWAARLTGVRVMEFAVGFGPKLFAKQAKSGITYSLRVLPLGGYCRFVADDEGGVKDREDAYYKAKVWKRAVIALSGPLLNFLTAVLLVFLLFAAIGIPNIVTVPVIDALVPDLPAQQAGFMAGDKIVSINGTPISTTAEASSAIALAGTAESTFVVERGGQSETLRVAPQYVESESRLMIGIQYRTVVDYSTKVRYDFVTSLKSAFRETADMSMVIFRTLGDLVFKGKGADQLTGPIGTVTLIKEQTQSGGVYSYLSLAAMISVNLGLFNLLPIPGLDGSKLIFLLLEKLRRRRMDPQKEGTVLLVGFALMMVLMVVVMFNDILRLFQ